MSQTRCDRCEQPARHQMTVGADNLTAVCCVHADELMRVARSLVPTDEAERGWSMWQEAHQEMCASTEGGSV